MTDPAGAPASPGPAAPLSPTDDKQWGSFAHLGGIIGIAPALIIWLVFRDRGPFTNSEGKEALNFQITVLIVEIIGWITAIALIGLIILPAAYILRIVFSILAFLAAKEGVNYRYPFAIRLIK